MPLREAIPFLKDAVARSLAGGVPSTYIFSGGVMYAQSPALLAAYPMPHILGDFALDADDLEGAINRMPTEPIIEAGDGSLIFKAGRLRSTTQLFAAELPEEVRTILNINSEWQPCPLSLWPAIQISSHFSANEGTWQRAICLLENRVTAMSNVSGIEVQAESLTIKSNQVALINDVVDYLIKLPAPEHWYEEPKSTLCFRWASGAWVRCRQLSVEYSLILDRVLADVSQDNMIEITQEWRDALADIHALAVDGKLATVDLGPNGIVGHGAHSEHVVEFATGCVRDTRWALRTLEPVFKTAKEWNPDARGAAPFRGENLRGAIIGMIR